MELQKTKEELERFAKRVIAQSRANLTRDEKKHIWEIVRIFRI
jgi:hypothetical protein